MKLTRVVVRPSFLAFVALCASLGSHACGAARNGGGAEHAGNAPPGASPTGNGPACVDQLPLEDCVDYAYEREQVVELLAELEQARDQRSIPVAAAGLDSHDPVIVTASLRLIGPFAGQDASVADKAALFMTSPYVATHQLAAAVLDRSPKHGSLAQQYRAGHSGSDLDVHPWTKNPPLELARVGFAGPYPNAAPYAPGDSSISAGFATTDAPDAVLAHYRHALQRDSVPFADLEAQLAQRTQQGYEEFGKQLQALQAEYMKTQDPKVLEKMQALGKSMNEGAQSALAAAPFPQGPARAAARVFVAEQAGTAPVRVVVVYPEPLVSRTIVMYAWSAPKYPPLPRTPKLMR